MVRKYKILLSAVVLVTISFAGYAGLTNAHSFRSGTNVVADKQERIDHSLFAAGNTINISSEVFGDVFCAGQTVTISGTVHGDVICAGQTLTVNGTVNGDVRLAGQSITVGGTVSGNATIGGQSFMLSSGAKIGGDVTLGSSDGTFSGSVGRDIAAGGGSILIANSVGRDIKGNIENLELGGGARVQGNIEFRSNNEIKKASEALVGGKITRSEAPRESKSEGSFVNGWFIYLFLAMLVTSMVLVLLFPRMLQRVTDRGLPRPWKALLVGLLAGLVVPVILIGLALTLVGIPLAILIGLSWLVVMILSGPIFGYYLGRLILRGSVQPLVIMLAGATVLLLTYFIPIIGFLAILIAFWGGAGMLLLELFHRTPRPAYNLSEVAVKTTSRKK